jgi:CRP/FNR family transcriptional regulator, cyclic AMP receptor protein
MADATSFYTALSESSRQSLRRRGSVRSYPAGAVLSREGLRQDTVFVVLRGVVKVGLTDADYGRQTLLALCGPGDVIGAEAALDHRANPAVTATVLGEEMRALTLSTSRFETFLNGNPGAMRALARELVKRLIQTEQRVGSLSTHSCVRRLARLLLDLAERFGGMPLGVHLGDAKDQIVVSGLTQADMAALIGSSRETVERTLRSWRLRKIVTTYRRYIRINDLNTLVWAAGLPSDHAARILELASRRVFW